MERGGLQRTWAAALSLFVLAGLTGALFRFAVAYVWGPDRIFGLTLGNVRHAHSHLMYFGWATPALMALIAYTLRQRTGRRLPGMEWILGVVFAMALLAYPPFLLWGYGLAPVGEARLPLSMMAAGLNVLGWYAFVGSYTRATWGLRRDGWLRGFDLSLGLLVLSTLGAWGLVAARPLGLAHPALTPSLVHFFLDGFSEGWFVLGVLALAASAAERSVPVWPMMVAASGVPFAFSLAVAPGLLPPALLVLGRMGGLLVGSGLLAAVAVLWPRVRTPLWRLALVCLALKAAGQVMVAVVPGVDWSAMHGLRILYLHLMLLGFVSLGLVAAARQALGAPSARGEGVMAAAILLVLATLLPLSGVWPAAAGGWAYSVAAWVSLAPVAAALGLLAGLRWREPQPAAV